MHLNYAYKSFKDYSASIKNKTHVYPPSSGLNDLPCNRGKFYCENIFRTGHILNKLISNNDVNICEVNTLK